MDGTQFMYYSGITYMSGRALRGSPSSAPTNCHYLFVFVRFFLDRAFRAE